MGLTYGGVFMFYDQEPTEKTGYLAGKGVLWLKLTRYIN